MQLADLSEQERIVIEKMRILNNQDETFRHLPNTLADCFAIMVERGAAYNGNGTGVMDQIFYSGDQSAFHKAYDPMNRLKNFVTKTPHIHKDKGIDLIIDTLNYVAMWLCCRREFRENGNAKQTVSGHS